MFQTSFCASPRVYVATHLKLKHWVWIECMCKIFTFFIVGFTMRALYLNFIKMVIFIICGGKNFFFIHFDFILKFNRNKRYSLKWFWLSCYVISFYFCPSVFHASIPVYHFSLPVFNSKVTLIQQVEKKKKMKENWSFCGPCNFVAFVRFSTTEEINTHKNDAKHFDICFFFVVVVVLLLFFEPIREMKLVFNATCSYLVVSISMCDTCTYSHFVFDVVIVVVVLSSLMKSFRFCLKRKANMLNSDSSSAKRLIMNAFIVVRCNDMQSVSACVPRIAWITGPSIKDH